MNSKILLKKHLELREKVMEKQKEIEELEQQRQDFIRNRHYY